MSEWWENPILHMARYNPLPMSIKMEDFPSQICMEEVIFKRELWCNPSEYREPEGYLVTERWVKGVLGTRTWNCDSFFYVWRCQRCKIVFIVGEYAGLRHDCTNPAPTETD